MFELEYLIAFGIGAGLVALTPIAASVAGKEKWCDQNHLWRWTWFNQAKSQVGLVIGSKFSGVFSG